MARCVIAALLFMISWVRWSRSVRICWVRPDVHLSLASPTSECLQVSSWNAHTHTHTCTTFTSSHMCSEIQASKAFGFFHSSTVSVCMCEGPTQNIKDFHDDWWFQGCDSHIYWPEDYDPHELVKFKTILWTLEQLESQEMLNLYILTPEARKL